MLLHDKTNINIDITKTVTPVNVFFNVLDIPLKSKNPPFDLMIEKQIHIFAIGSINFIKKFSIKEINKTNEELAIVPLVTFPVKIYSVAINGAKHSIVSLRPLK